MAQERKARIKLVPTSGAESIELDSKSTDITLGSAFYDKGKGKKPISDQPVPELDEKGANDVGSYWSYDSPMSEEVKDVTCEVDLCNYDFIPELSPEPYVPHA